MTAPERIRVDVVQDRPPSGMWHCGPNPSWVTVTHLPTMTQARAYHRSQHKARDAAMACVQMMIEDLLVTDDVCNYPEALAASPEVATLIAETRREGWNVAIEASAALVEGSVYTSNGGDCTLEPALPKMRGMDMHHATISAAIRALKEETP